MPDPTGPTVAVVATTTGLTIFGVATGLDPGILIAGFGGGIWSQLDQEKKPFIKRLGSMAVSSLSSGYLTPLVMWFLQLSGGPVQMLQLPVAFIIGLTTHKHIGPRVDSSMDTVFNWIENRIRGPK